MITVSIKHLTNALDKTEDFRLPDMNSGVGYLYNNLYRRLSQGEEVRLSDIDYSLFELDDISTLWQMHDDIFETHSYKLDNITRVLQGLPPVTVTTMYI